MKIVLSLLAVLAVACGGEVPAADVVAETWTCSMHPQIQLDRPGSCPICGMDLIPVEGGAPSGAASLVLGPEAAALADIRTAPVVRRHAVRQVRMVGKVAFDETRLAYITARVPGRLDRLFVDYTGVTVRKGDHMVEIYSPKLYSTQQELLQSVAAAESLPTGVVATVTHATVEAARERLRLWGLEPAQIDEIVARGTPSENVVLNAPSGGVVVHKNALEGDYVEEGSRIYTIADLSKVWVLLDAYESDLAWIRYGQDVAFTTAAWPGETFRGRIAFIDPVLDDRTRTIKVRLNVDNPDGRLKPEMFVKATVSAALTPHGRVVDPDLAARWMCPMHPEAVADKEDDCDICGMKLVPARELGFVAEGEEMPPLVVPASAPLLTGRRAVVYVHAGDGAFVGREVVLGPRAGDVYVVHEGLAEGEEVVVHGAFKIDAELQIRAQPSMMSPEAR